MKKLIYIITVLCLITNLTDSVLAMDKYEVQELSIEDMALITGICDVNSNAGPCGIDGSPTTPCAEDPEEPPGYCMLGSGHGTCGGPTILQRKNNESCDIPGTGGCACEEKTQCQKVQKWHCVQHYLPGPMCSCEHDGEAEWKNTWTDCWEVP